MGNLMIEKIKHISDWHPLSSIGSSTSQAMSRFWNGLYDGNHIGVYQVSFETPKDLIHPEIGYIGKSKILPTRLYELSNNTRSHKSNHHNCGRYLRDQGVDISSVNFRCLFIDDNFYGDVETHLQEQMRKKYGYRTGFKWIEASAGVESTYLKFKDIANRLKPEELADAQGYIISLMVQNEIDKMQQDKLKGFFGK